jgi:integrase
MAQRDWLGTWAGGRVFRRRSGLGYTLERMVGDVRFAKTLDAKTEEEALAELALFVRDPQKYTTRREARAVAAADAIVVNAESVDKVAAHLQREGRSPKYIKNVISYLGVWAEDLRGRDLRGFKLKDLLAIVNERETARGKRIAALKTFTAYFREVEASLELNEDPTIALMMPPARPEKMKRSKGYPMELVEQVYAAIYDWENDVTEPDAFGRVRKRGVNVAPMRTGDGDAQGVRDVLVLRAKYGMHGTEIDRIATGGGQLDAVKAQKQIAGTLKFQHKTGRVHVLSVDRQGFAAAKRLQARGKVISDGYVRTSLKYACRKLGVDPLNPGELRHSFATWAGEVGVEVKPKEAGVSMEAIAASMGHQSKRTTGFFYWGVKIPAMVLVPIKLRHRDDPKEK